MNRRTIDPSSCLSRDVDRYTNTSGIITQRARWSLRLSSDRAARAYGARNARTRFDFDIEMIEAGAFVCGEEMALTARLATTPAAAAAAPSRPVA
jgi:NADH:ubiquinone oxidoreductase subunit F (NADH-binding)